MASAKIITREDWRRRALELARARHLDGTARLVSDGPVAREYHVPNTDRRGDGHVVRYDVATGETTCGCVAGSYSRPCAHSGAALHSEQMREEARCETGPSEAWSWWMHGGAYDE